jgi:hypothetical protein
MDPVESLSQVVKLAEERRVLNNLLKRVRDVSETDAQTLTRIISERDYLVALIDGHFNGRNNPFRSPSAFDYNYTHTLPGAMEHVFSLLPKK